MEARLQAQVVLARRDRSCTRCRQLLAVACCPERRARHRIVDRIHACALEKLDCESHWRRVGVVGSRTGSGVSAGAVGDCQGGGNKLGGRNGIQSTDSIVRRQFRISRDKATLQVVTCNGLCDQVGGKPSRSPRSQFDERKQWPRL